jgi:anti-sigma B factor antagonist
MKIEMNDSEGTILVTPEGDIEMMSMKPFKETMFDLGNNHDKHVVINFANVQYLDSSGMGVLLTLSKMLKAKDKNLRIINCSDRIRRILQLSSLQDICSKEQ